MRKSIKAWLACLTVAAVSSCAFVSCKKAPEDISGTVSTETEKMYVSFDKTQAEIVIGSETYVLASYLPVEGLAAEYSSKNPEIATVDKNGKVTAMRLGETVVTVKYGEATAKCKITVVQGKSVPSLYFSRGWGDSVTIETNGKVNVSSYVLFNGNTYEDHTATYTVDDDTVGEVVNGVFTPKKVGSCRVSLKADWRGIGGVLMEKTLEINVIPNVELYVNDGNTDYIMHNKAKAGKETYDDFEIDFTVTALEDGQAIASSVKVVSGADVIKYENGKLKVVNENIGSAELSVSCTDSRGNVYTVRVYVTVYLSGPADCGFFNPDWLSGF